MAVGFGFSVTDICMGLKIIKDSVNALDDEKGAANDLRALVTELDNLREGLSAVRDLLADESLPHAQHVALERAGNSCQKAIEEFLVSIAKYQPLLDTATKGIAQKFRKIRWGLCRKEDVANFRSQIERHASSISMLLISFQARQRLRGDSLTQIPVMTADMGDHLSDMMQSMSLEQRQCFMIIMQQNKDLLMNLEEMRKMLSIERAMPSQILLQQPVILVDPFGKKAPFHLEFIDSPECFMAVLHVRFSKAGVSPEGLAKLDRQEFSLEDSQGRQKVDLQKPWRRAFRPGQQVDMRMIFHRFSCAPNTCPGCLNINNEVEDDDETEWSTCGLFYLKYEAITKESENWDLHRNQHLDVQMDGQQTPYILSHPRRGSELKTFIPPDEAEKGSFDGFRHVQIVSQPLSLLDPLFPALQLIEDFSHFADLLADVPSDTSPFLDNIQFLNHQAKQFLYERDNDFPAFASYSQIQERKTRLTQESLSLRHYINTLITSLCNDTSTKQLVAFIAKG
ncbi:uncharacterized protein KY384_008439 [Bacidia gigantensis]|uniref:uncharacterized protein n=1 Tax=Bacidia gigantensis TaxID=2732470 RepID=UPI001D03747D|nr:uncharacterized protein KY384_008439 [Bacidia gigantensis]KAG8527010.1 hypothetical protein KY384_008439 [Bacidia gigantensis]